MFRLTLKNARRACQVASLRNLCVLDKMWSAATALVLRAMTTAISRWPRRREHIEHRAGGRPRETALQGAGENSF
jgi:hypothetical protein